MKTKTNKTNKTTKTSKTTKTRKANKTIALTDHQVRTLPWQRLTRLWIDNRLTKATRRAVAIEARRCGYAMTNLIPE